MEQVYDDAAVRALDRVRDRGLHPREERIEAIGFLAEVARKAPPWDGKWWGTQPAKGEPPARTIDWSRHAPRAGDDPRPGELKGMSVPVRVAAVEAIVAIKDRGSLPMLRAQFSAEENVEIRRAIASALGKMADVEALDILIAAVRDPGSPAAGPRRLARGRRDDRHEQGRESPVRSADPAGVDPRPPAAGDCRAGAFQGPRGGEPLLGP